MRITDTESLPGSLSPHWRRLNWLTRAVQMPKMKHCLYANPKHDTNCAAHSFLAVFGEQCQAH